jgi:hypothetical protein
MSRTIYIAPNYSLLEIDTWLQNNYHTFFYTDMRRTNDNPGAVVFIYAYQISYQTPSSYGNHIA